MERYPPTAELRGIKAACGGVLGGGKGRSRSGQGGGGIGAFAGTVYIKCGSLPGDSVFADVDIVDLHALRQRLGY